MIKTLSVTLALAASLAIAGAAAAQSSGGLDAKGNAPLKPAHTVNDGSAKRGANSFTAKQAQDHIEKSGFASVSGLAKGKDGVWRGQATRDGAPVDVAMDFKGNVSTGVASSTTQTRTTTTDRPSPAPTGARHHRHRHPVAACANPRTNGAACSGVDRNRNGVSDKEDRAITAGARP